MAPSLPAFVVFGIACAMADASDSEAGYPSHLSDNSNDANSDANSDAKRPEDCAVLHWAGTFRRDFIGSQTYQCRPIGSCEPGGTVGRRELQKAPLDGTLAVAGPVHGVSPKQRLHCGVGGESSYQLEKDFGPDANNNDVSFHPESFNGVLDAVCQVHPARKTEVRCAEVTEPASIEMTAMRVGHDCAVLEFVTMYTEFGSACAEGGPNSGVNGCHTCMATDRSTRIGGEKALPCDWTKAVPGDMPDTGDIV